MNKDKYRWELVEDGYHRKSRYIQSQTGLIVGEVTGSNYEPSAPWYAFAGTVLRHIGIYTTEGLAKAAVERAQSKGGRK